jgi:hypothetical protein
MTLAADPRCGPCPFCKGRRARVNAYSQHGVKARIACLALDCGALGPMRHDAEDAIEAWNAGATEPLIKIEG